MNTLIKVIEHGNKKEMSSTETRKFEKLYYNISDVAKVIGESTSLIRFWEKKFPAIRPKKNTQGVRLYTPHDLKTIIRIHNLVKHKGFTLEGANLELKKMKTIKQEETLINKLQEIRNFFSEFIKT